MSTNEKLVTNKRDQGLGVVRSMWVREENLSRTSTAPR